MEDILNPNLTLDVFNIDISGKFLLESWNMLY